MENVNGIKQDLPAVLEALSVCGDYAFGTADINPTLVVKRSLRECFEEVFGRQHCAASCLHIHDPEGCFAQPGLRFADSHRLNPGGLGGCAPPDAVLVRPSRTCFLDSLSAAEVDLPAKRQRALRPDYQC